MTDDEPHNVEEAIEPRGMTRPPVGAGPGTLAIPPGAMPPLLRMTQYDTTRIESAEIDMEEAVRHVQRAREAAGVPGGGVLWLEVQGLGDEVALRTLADALGLHPLTLEDVVHTHQRPKVEAFDDHLVVFARMVCGGESDRLREQLALVLCAGVVVTFQEEYSTRFDPLHTRLQTGQGRMRKSGADYLAYALLDSVVDAYFPIVEEVGDMLEQLEEEALEEPTRATVRKINKLRYGLVQLRRAAWPLREAIAFLLRGDSQLIGESVKAFLRDVHDHTVQVAELIEVQREAVGGLMNTYLSSVANRQNEVMKVLTLVTSIFIPLSFLAGVYGMNFEYMPELGWRWGYPVLLLLMALLVLVMLAYFQRRGWIPRHLRR